MTLPDYYRPIIYINGMAFRDVTNVTTGGITYNYEEAVALSKGKHIVTSGYIKPKKHKDK